MSDRAKKISELTAKASLANSDVFVIVDASANTTKKVAANTVKSYVLNLSYIVANTAAFVANSSHSVIFADNGNIGQDIFVQLPTTTTNGKTYTVKNINNSYDVFVHSAANGTLNIIENHDLTGTLLGNVEIAYASSVTWMYDNGIYRIINKY